MVGSTARAYYHSLPVSYHVGCVHIVYTYNVRNVTLSMDERLLARGREYARTKGTTLNQLIQDLLEREVSESGGSAIESMFENAKRLGVRSKSGYLTREEAHERR